MTTTLPPEIVKKLSEMSAEKFDLLLEMFTHIGSLAQAAKHHLENLGLARDTFSQTMYIGRLANIVDDELHARFPAYKPLSSFLDSPRQDVHAVGLLFALEMLCDAPDLLQLALERLTDEYRAFVFEGKDPKAPGFRSWRR
jgi:hypothetical protein